MSLLIIMLILFLFEIPIGFCMIASAFIVSYFSGNINLFQSIVTRIAYTPNSFVLIAVPLFMLAAAIMNDTGITERIFGFALSLIGHIKGGLALANVLASMIFAGMSGSGVADASGLGQIEIKVMNAQGYDRAFSAAVTATSACLGPIIPPSIAMVIFGAITNISTGRLLVGGALPGIMIGFGLMIVAYIISRHRNYPSGPKPSVQNIIKEFKRTFFALLTPIILIGGIISGKFTPTEAASMAVFYAFILACFIEKKVSFKKMYNICINTAIDCSAIIFIVACASGFGVVVLHSEIFETILRVLMRLAYTPFNGLIIMFLITLVAGHFMEDLSLMMILAPLFAPFALEIGIDMVQFGVVMVLGLMLGMATPPVGGTMFISCYIAKVSIWDYTKEVYPFVFIMILVILIVIAFPNICTFLPNLVFGK